MSVVRFTMRVAVVAIVLGASAAPAVAQRVVALAPLSTLGSEDTSARAQAFGAQLEKAIAAQPGTTAMTAAQVSSALRRAKRGGVASCDGELACLAELGKAVGAQVLVTGQLGGLGDATVLYLAAIESATGKELGSTTWTPGATDSAAAAVVRLLSPAAYVGALELRGPDLTASVFVNGAKLPSGARRHVLPVGTHALRVTKPEVRDFVRFVDIAYGETTTVDVALTPLPVVQRDLAGLGAPGVAPARASGPWYRSWWAVAGGAVVLTAVSAVVVYSLTDDFAPDVTLP